MQAMRSGVHIDARGDRSWKLQLSVFVDDCCYNLWSGVVWQIREVLDLGGCFKLSRQVNVLG